MPIDRLILIAGPKAVGKSHFMRRLQQGSLPQLVEAFQMGDPDSWHYGAGADFQDAGKRAQVRGSAIERFVLHYEITGPWNPRYYARSYAEDKPLELLGFSKKITFATLWAPCDVLLNRFLARNPRFLNKMMWLRYLYWHGFQIRKMGPDFRPLYRNPERLFQIYVDWIRFCLVDAAKQHWLVDSSDQRYACALLERFPDDLVKYVDAWSKVRSVVAAQR